MLQPVTSPIPVDESEHCAEGRPGQMPVQPVVSRTAVVGVALWHFTEPTRAYLRCHLTDAHVATTVLTKQIELALATEDPIGRLADLLVAPARIARPDGTTARELLGESWGAFESDVAMHVACTVAYATTHGLPSLLSVSGWHSRSDPTPWWGTPAWTRAVGQFARRPGTGPNLAAILRTCPEIVDHLTLSRILSLEHGDRVATRDRAADAA